MGSGLSTPESPKTDKKAGHKGMPGRRICIETDPCGNPRWIVRRHSHHSHHHRHWGDERAHITNEELAAMRERERELREANEALTRENHILKANLRAAEHDLRQHRTWVAQLQNQVRYLETENADLRRSLESHSGGDERHRKEVRELRKKNTRLENENESLTANIRDLTRKLCESVDDRVRKLTHNVNALTREISEWRRRYDDLDRRYRRLCDNMDDYIASNDRLTQENRELRQTIGTYERILRRHHLIS